MVICGDFLFFGGAKQEFILQNMILVEQNKFFGMRILCGLGFHAFGMVAESPRRRHLPARRKAVRYDHY